MKLHKWSDIKKEAYKGREAKLAEIHKEAMAELDEMALAEIRKVAGKTQMEVSKLTKITQTELSKIERRDDHRVSTLRKYVEALGGELVILADFGDRSVKIRGV